MAVDNFQDRLALIEDELSALSARQQQEMHSLNGLLSASKAQLLIRRSQNESEAKANRLFDELQRRLNTIRNNAVTKEDISQIIVETTQTEGEILNNTYFSSQGSVTNNLDNQNGFSTVDWQDLKLISYDGQIISFGSGSYQADLYSGERLFYFYGKRDPNVIEIVPEGVFNSDPSSYTQENGYILLWQLVIGGADPSFTANFTYAPFMEPVFKLDEQAILDEVLEGFQIQSLAKLARDYDEEVDVIALDPAHPLRVDLPVGTRIEIGSVNAVVRSLAKSGATSIAIRLQRITERQGALIRFNLDYLQVQLQAQPDRVRAYVQNVEGTAQANFELIQTANSAIASIQTSLDANGINATGNFEQRVQQVENELGTLTSSTTTINNMLSANGITASSNISNRVSAAQGTANDAISAATSITNAITSNGFSNVSEFVSRVSTNQSEITQRVSVEEYNTEAIVQLLATESTSTATIAAENINISGVVGAINLGSTKITNEGINTSTLATDTAFVNSLVANTAFVDSLTATNGFFDNLNVNELNALTANTGALTLTGALTIDPSNGSIDFGNFEVDGNGNVTATNATISGAITATSGSFTGQIFATSGVLGDLNVNGNLTTAGGGFQLNGSEIRYDNGLEYTILGEQSLSIGRTSGLVVWPAPSTLESVDIAPNAITLGTSVGGAAKGSAGYVTGTLSINTSGQLLWNGTVIS